MKAVGIKTSLAITEKDSFIDFEIEKPKVNGRNLLIKIEAISVNPIDFKMRQNSAKNTILETPKILGWDAYGIVEEVGENVSMFKIGDKVYYAGDISKQGSNAEYQLIDERIVALAPKKLTIEESVAMPLTTLTAWEILFDRIKICHQKDKGKSILIIGGAGGVGSIAIQLAKMSGLNVVTTASREESINWCKNLGADYVVNHKNLKEEVEKIGFKNFDFIVDFVDINAYWDTIVELIKPQGHIASITGSDQPIVLNKLKTKSVSFSWEYIFTRALYETEDMKRQNEILTTVANMLDNGDLKSTLNHTIKGLSSNSFKEAHSMLESGKTIGKIVIKY